MNTKSPSAKTRAKISKAKKSIPMTQEHKDAISAAMLKRNARIRELLKEQA